MVARLCSGPKSYVVVLDDGRVWKRHLDHMRWDSMDSAVPQPNVTREPQKFFGSSFTRPSWYRRSITTTNTIRHPSYGSRAVRDSSQFDTRSSEVGQTPLRWPSRMRNAPDRLIETVWKLEDWTLHLFYFNCVYELPGNKFELTNLVTDLLLLGFLASV